ncbi:hypothetical protein D9Q98_005183 [Chlorella vulgaris]|uniref:CCD97-like C-terminal domain-containing protein n=1 Tax=Chlorella vulgaris TaxID=3077 RepID=A0A9D4TNL8_CHLVU|nr:hypothetical protein D9Q98_005183 [Chlorella vulgaris]
MGNDTRGLPSDTVEQLAARLAAQSDLRLPAQLRQQASAPTAADKTRYLTQLITHDPGVFLERHGSELTDAELAHFQSLRGDYEVDFYCKVLEDRTDQLKRSQVAKNRRLAYMARLEADGTYFGEEAMRDRQPALHHQYIGQFQPSGTMGASTQADEPGCQAGNALAQSILRGQEELDLRQRQAAEQQRWDQVEEESDEEDEEEQQQQDNGGQPSAAPPQQQQRETSAQGKPDEAAGVKGQQAAAGGNQAQQEQESEEQADEASRAGEAVAGSVPLISEEEAQDNADTFRDLMRQRFIGGLDSGVDYAAIDADAELDDHWAEEAGRDAEEKYFDD